MMTLIQLFARRGETECGRPLLAPWRVSRRLRALILRAGAAVLFALALTGLSPTQLVLAQDGDGDVTVTNGSYTLQSGESISGNLVVFGGAVEVETGATVNGDVVVLGGSTEIAGNVEGSITQLGGSLELMESATVGGDVNRVGGSYEQAEGVTIDGAIHDGILSLGRTPGLGPDVSATPPTPPRTGFDMAWAIFWEITQAIMWTTGVSLLAVLIVSFMPNPVSRARLALADAPVLSLGVGLLTLVAVLIVLVLMVVTCVLIPVTPVAALALAAGWLLGMTAVGQLVGERLAAALNLQGGSPAAVAGAGTALVMVLTYFVAVVPCVGWLMWPLVSAFGLGAVALTRFGRQSYPGYGAPPTAATPSVALDPQI